MTNINELFQLIPAPQLREDNTIFDALELIHEKYGMIVVVLDNEGRLSGIASPGDLRKAILHGNSVHAKLSSVMNKEPICIKLSELETAADINHSISDELRALYSNISMLYAMVPVITNNGRVAGLISLESLTSYVSNPKLKMNHRTVLIVGGAGYVGSVLTRRLLKDGWTVRILDKLLYGDKSLNGLNSENYTLYRGDAGNIDDIVRSAEGVDAVVYLAELVGDPACSFAPQSTLKTNYLAVTAMAHLCSHLNINRFIYTSSCSVYGASKNPEEVLKEDSPIQPVSLYGRMKALVEQSILSVCNLPNPLFAPTILRLATVFGHSYRPRFDLVVNTFVKDALQKGKIEIFGGNQWRPNVHVMDVARAITKTLDASAEDVRGQVFNVGDTCLNYTINDLADITKKVFPEVEVIKKATAVDQRNYRVDFSKIRDVLGFQCKVGISEGMLELKETFENNDLTELNNPRYNNYERVQELNFI